MNFKNIIADFIKDEEGLTIVEYAVGGSLIAAGAALSFGALGDAVIGVIDGLTGELGGDAPTP